MALNIQSQAEPLPGYRLLERLGGGGFGEVWKCVAPGGLHKAIKFVYGDLESHDDEGARAGQELKALSRVKSVHHPYILSIERFDIIDGRLLIVMELADRTLWDRYKESRAQGHRGIPRRELLSYLLETAEALDLMNNQYQLQHLDIKPQNLFLVFNHIKVADFGLVKDLEGVIASVTGGVTPVYAAPETFDGYVTRFSDQYSLAIVYQELLTGQRPFTGTTLRQLVMQHMQAVPDLSQLPEADRPIVARALSKNPEDRYPTCNELITALIAATSASDLAAAAPTTNDDPSLQRPPSDAPRAPRKQELAQDDQLQITQGRPAPTAAAPKPAAAPRPQPALPVDSAPASAKTPQPPRDRHTPHKLEAPGGSALLRGTAAQMLEAPPSAPSHSTTMHGRAARHAASSTRPGGVLFPALVIGLGLQGQQVLKGLRRQIAQQLGSPQVLPNIRMLCIDADPEDMSQATRGGDAALRSNETLLTRLHRASHYLKSRECMDGLETWLDPRMLYRIPRQLVPQGVRALGRLAFVDNFPIINRRLELELEACLDNELLKQAAQRTSFTARSTIPRVYVVASLAGGTGSGMLIDVAYLMRTLLLKHNIEQPDVVGVLLLPAAPRTAPQLTGQANCFAALRELRHFGEDHSVFRARYSTGDVKNTPTPFQASGPVLQRCVLLGDEQDEPTWHPPENDESPLPARPQVIRTAQWLFTDLCSGVAQAAEERRQEWSAQNSRLEAEPPRMLYQTVGNYRLLWPRQPLQTLVGRSLCQRVVQRWISKDAKPLRDAVKHWVSEQWLALSLSSEQLIGQLQTAAEQVLRQAPDTAFDKIMAPIAAVVLAPPGKMEKNSKGPPLREQLKLSTVVETLNQLEQLLGVPEACQPPTPQPPETPPELPLLLQTVQESAKKRNAEAEQHLVELVVRLIESPEFRLAGAEEAIRQFGVFVEQALQSQEELVKELQERAVSLYQRIQTILDKPAVPRQETSSWKMVLTRKPQLSSETMDRELLDRLRAYVKCRYQSLILQQTTAFYVGVRGRLSDYLREVDFCRQRLTELARMFTDTYVETRGGPTLRSVTACYHNTRLLLPEGCASLDEAVRVLEQDTGPAELLQLDHALQEVLHKQFRALVHVCMSATSMLQNLAPAMQDVAESFLAERLANVDAVELFLHRPQPKLPGPATEENVIDALQQAFEQSVPDFGKTADDNEACILAMPASPQQEHFRSLLQRALPEQKVIMAPAVDEIVFYREQWHTTLASLKYLHPKAEEMYRKLLAQELAAPHSRFDIPQWLEVR